jgi:Xaa-Pro aminopeptidase
MAGPTDAILHKGDTLFVDPGAVYNGYWGEYSRMGVVGEPTSRQEEIHRQIRDLVQRTVAEAIKPNLHFREILERTTKIGQEIGLAEEVWRTFLEPPFKLIAHGIGLDSAEAPYVRADFDGELKPGMVITVESTLRDDGVTYGSEEDVVVTDTGAEILSELDTGLFRIATHP